MRYVIADAEGASRGHFDDYGDVLEVIDEARRDDRALLGELMILRYDEHGARVGEPVPAERLAHQAARDSAVVIGTSNHAVGRVASSLSERSCWKISSSRVREPA